jgi:hypothetical protein
MGGDYGLENFEFRISNDELRMKAESHSEFFIRNSKFEILQPNEEGHLAVALNGMLLLNQIRS